MDHNNRCRQHPTYIADNFNSLDQVISALREAGFESSNLILGIDFTKSNEWTGRDSFHRKSLHAVGSTLNPYEQVISIIGRTLSPFDKDNLIPCFGFGDVSTHDEYAFSFYPDNRPCNGPEEALARYREIVPHLKLSGPTSFAAVIDVAIDIVERSGEQYHVLVIIADGQATRSPDIPPGQLSPQEQATINSIVAASKHALSIIFVGVGDGPWDEMQQFDDNIPHREFDNFQFVNFTKIMLDNTEASKKETAFALAALMEIPFQYRATQRLQHTRHDLVGGSRTWPLPPPPEVIDHDNAVRSIPIFETVQPTTSVEPMDSNLRNSFTDSLISGSEQIVSQQSDLDVRITERAQRSKNFSPEEDCLLVSAWLNTSKDPIVGVDQQTRQFWARVHAYFVENGGNLNNRSQISISNRWQEINREVGKFVGFVTQIENRQQSGTTEESRINDAQQMYASVVGKRFQLEHCWVILKREPKWQFERASLHQKSNKKQKNHGNASPASSTPSTADSVSLGEDNDTFVYQNRPIGQKAAKERLKRRQGKEKVGETSVATILQQLKDSFDEIEVEKKLDRKIMLEQQALLIKQKQEKQEMKIMKMDTSKMDPISAAYFEDKKLEIMAKKSTNL